MDNGASFAKGLVKGVASDIEKWIRDYAEHTPTEKQSRGSDDQFTLTLYQYLFGRSGGDPIKLPYAQVAVTGWSNGTTDVRVWTIPADRSFSDMEREDEARRSDMAQMSAALLRRFPYVSAQAAQPKAMSADDGPQGKADEPIALSEVERRVKDKYGKVTPKKVEAMTETIKAERLAAQGLNDEVIAERLTLELDTVRRRLGKKK